MRYMKTKKEIEEAYNSAMEQMYYYDDLVTKTEFGDQKDYYREQRNKYANEACCYGWVLGKEGY